MLTVSVPIFPRLTGRVVRGLSRLLLSLLIVPTAFAQTTYYVATNGNDSNAGRSSDSPFQSLAKVSSLSLQPGDQILLRRGDTFRGTLYVRQSGSSGNPIVVDAYGSGNKPIIAGSTLVTGWNNIGNNTWQASCPSCGSRVTGVYRDNTTLPLGRYPNLSDSNKGYLTIQSHNGTSQLTSQQGLPANYTGGEAVIRSTAWVIDRATITGQGGNTLSLSYSTIYQPIDGWGFFVQNHPATLDQSGEWYYNPSDKTIRLFDNQNNPNNQQIAVTTAGEGINLGTSSNVTVRNVKITQTLSTGLLATNSNGITLSGNEITQSGENGVALNGSGNTVLVENNLIDEANNVGFQISVYQNLTFRGNTVQRIGLTAGRGGNGDGTYSGFQSACNSNSLIENNVFDNIGYAGVSVANSSTVRYNRVSNYCMTKSDGGGIYVSNGGRANLNDLKFQSNIVYSGIGAPEGAQIASTSGAHGIFLDDCTVNAEVTGNSIFRVAGMGIFLRGAYNCTVKNNTSFDNGEEQLKIVANGTCTPRNIINQNNILVSKLATAKVAGYETGANDLGSFGSFDYNYYARPFEDQFKIQAVYNPGTGGTGPILSLSEWQNRFGLDKNSANSPVTYKSQMVTQTGNTLLNYPYTSGAGGWSVWSPYGNGRADWDNSGKLDGGSMKLSFASASNQSDSYLLATVNLGGVRKGQTYQLVLDGIASADNKRLTVYPRQQGGNYRDLADRTTFVLGAGRQSYEATFTANADEPAAILVVQAYEDGQTAWVDNLIMREATLTTLNPDDYVKIVYNASGQSSNVGLDATYRDVKNNAYTGQITLAPYSSAVLLKQVATATPTPTPTPVTLRDPENPASTTAGLDYRYYEGAWTSLPDFTSLTPAKTGTTGQVDLSVKGRDTNYGLRFTGYFNAPTDGTYTFYTTSDDGSKLYIGSTEVVSNDNQHGDQEKAGSIGLKAGKHAITVTFFQASGGQTLVASYEGPNIGKQAIPASSLFRIPGTTTTTPTTPAPTGTGVYLSDLNWTSATNGYGPVEKDKSNGDAAAGDGRTITLNGVTYAKGLGVHAPASISYSLGGQYSQFITDMGLDDEMTSASCGKVEFQIYLDGNLAYSSGSMTPASATKSATLDVSGKQTLTLVVTDGGDGVACDHGDWAGARLIPASGSTTTPTPTPTAGNLRDPENPASTTAGLDYRYYEGAWTSLPDFTSLTPAKTGTTGQVDLSVKGRDTNYGLRFTGYFNAPTDGTYTFYTTSDDGSKLYIGSTEVVSNDNQHGDQEKAGSIGLKAGKHAITVTFFQASGGQTLVASYEGPNIGKQAIPAGSLFRIPGTTTTTPTTPAPTGTGVYLSDLNWTSATNGYGPVEKDKSNGEAAGGDGRTITLNGVTYAKGLGVHAPASISYSLGGQYSQFITDMGLDDEMTSATCGNVEFQVYLDGNLAYRSGNMNALTATKSATLDVSGKQTLTLVVTDGGDGTACDHGDWAGARLIKSGSGRVAATVQPEAGSFTADVYPNPARETLNVRYWADTTGDLSLQLLNESGRSVRQQSQPVTAGENLISLPVRDLSGGFYVLSLIQGQQRITRKVILAD